MKIIERKEVYLDKDEKEVELTEDININQVVKVEKVKCDNGEEYYLYNGTPLFFSDEYDERMLEIYENICKETFGDYEEGEKCELLSEDFLFEDLPLRYEGCPELEALIAVEPKDKKRKTRKCKDRRSNKNGKRKKY